MGREGAVKRKDKIGVKSKAKNSNQRIKHYKNKWEKNLCFETIKTWGYGRIPFRLINRRSGS